MPRRDLPEFLGYVAPPVEFIGGICLRARLRHPLRIAGDAVVRHHRDLQLAPLLERNRQAQQANQNSHFWKNVSMKGGLVVLFITGAGRYALDRLLARR